MAAGGVIGAAEMVTGGPVGARARVDTEEDSMVTVLLSWLIEVAG